MNEAGWIQAIRERSDIGDVIGWYVQMNWRGKRGLGLCPFCAESKLVFSVDRESQLYHCFGCQADGDVFTFVMHRFEICFFEAASRLAHDAGVPVPEDLAKKVLSEVAIANETKLERLRAKLAETSNPAEAAQLLAEAEQTRWPK